ncbi:MAG: tryptophan-rich sensory protein [Spirochaetales bacterium]|nr:tryptophan-rich sensory protein [Spirochaetales bacterium]
MKINKRLLITGNIVAFLATIVVNYLANALPIGGSTTGALSDSYPNLFVPAGITFSIWGIIYLFLLGFIVYQARDLFKKEQNDNKFIDKIGIFFILSSLSNIGWIFVWHYRQIWLSILFMLAILGILLVIYLRLDTGKTKPALLEKIFVHIPFSIYLGWITVATIANITALLVSLGWDGFGFPEYVWAMVMIAAACIITLLVLFTRKDIAYALVIIWAIAGIIIKRTNPVFQPQQGIVITSWICIGLIGLGVIASGLKMVLKKQNQSSE